MNNHLVFCCNDNCRDYEIRKLMKNNQAIYRTRDSVILGDDRYWFYININENPEKLCGKTFIDYRCCEKYELDDKTNLLLKAILSANRMRGYI